MQFKITTFNLRLNHINDKENAWGYRLNSVIKYIKTTKPLILGAQEVLDGMLNDLSNNLEDYKYIGLTRKQNEEANPIFYNKKILDCRESGTFWLSRSPNIPNTIDFASACIRICTWGEFLFKDKRNIRFRVFNTHLDHISKLAKIEGTKIIIKKVYNKNNETKLPTIIMGDLNSTREEEVIKYIKSQKEFTDIYEYLPQSEYGSTFHNFNGIKEGTPIDFIFVSNEFKILRPTIYRKKILNKYPSDHYPVTTLIQL